MKHLLVSVLFFSGCFWSRRSLFQVAEKLWLEKQYEASVQAFDKAYYSDPLSFTGVQAYFRAAVTEAFFLQKYDLALAKFYKIFHLKQAYEFKTASLIYIAYLNYFTSHYEKAVESYEQLLLYPSFSLKEDFAVLLQESKEVWMFRLAESYSILLRFTEALSTYQKLISLTSIIEWKKKAEYKIATLFISAAEHFDFKAIASLCSSRQNCYEIALQKLEKYCNAYPLDNLAEAKYFIASALEGLNQQKLAYQMYQELQGQDRLGRLVKLKLEHLENRFKGKASY